ncbi:hypothetical protein [uncultured Gammaproteobacteria bacterium]|nr:hypothetical protein [uncultured Gammaproteobacteria bacterium]
MILKNKLIVFQNKNIRRRWHRGVVLFFGRCCCSFIGE